MNIRQLHTFADSMWNIEHEALTAAEKAEQQGDYKPADRAEGMVLMQGRSAWPARRCSPEMAHVIDRLPERYDPPEPLTPREALKFWSTVLAPAAVGVIGFAVLTAYGYL